MQFLAACNGMVLACTGLPPPVPTGRRRPRAGLSRDPSRTVFFMWEYVLLNPVTRKTSTIPPPPLLGLQQLVQLPRVRPPRLPRSLHGRQHGILGKSEAFLFSSYAGEWRRLDASRLQNSTPPQPQYASPKLVDCCCVLGIGYKIAAYSISAASSQSNTAECLVCVIIMAFDVMNGCLFWVISPVLRKDSICSGHYFIGKSAGCLTFAYLDHRKSLSLWMLHDPLIGNWSFTHNVNLNDAPVPLPKGLLSSFAFHPLEADLMFVSCSGRL